MFKYIEIFYNRQRLHQSLGDKTPEQFEAANAPAIAAQKPGPLLSESRGLTHSITLMHPILPYSLWLGNAHDCGDSNLISDNGIQSVVQLAIEEPIPLISREVQLFRIPLYDGGDNELDSLQLAIRTSSDLMRSKRRTLICCSAGVSRSPAVAACAIATAENTDPEKTLIELSKIIRTDVSPVLWHDLLSAFSSLLRQ